MNSRKAVFVAIVLLAAVDCAWSIASCCIYMPYPDFFPRVDYATAVLHCNNTMNTIVPQLSISSQSQLRQTANQIWVSYQCTDAANNTHDIDNQCLVNVRDVPNVDHEEVDCDPVTGLPSNTVSCHTCVCFTYNSDIYILSEQESHTCQFVSKEPSPTPYMSSSSAMIGSSSSSSATVISSSHLSSSDGMLYSTPSTALTTSDSSSPVMASTETQTPSVISRGRAEASPTPFKHTNLLIILVAAVIAAITISLVMLLTCVIWITTKRRGDKDIHSRNINILVEHQIDMLNSEVKPSVVHTARRASYKDHTTKGDQTSRESWRDSQKQETLPHTDLSKVAPLPTEAPATNYTPDDCCEPTTTAVAITTKPHGNSNTAPHTEITATTTVTSDLVVDTINIVQDTMNATTSRPCSGSGPSHSSCVSDEGYGNGYITQVELFNVPKTADGYITYNYIDTHQATPPARPVSLSSSDYLPNDVV